MAKHVPKSAKHQFIIFLDDWKRPYRRTKNYFEVNICNSKASFKVKTKERYQTEIIKQKDSWIWFSVHWLAEHAPKSTKYQLNQFGRLNARNLREAAKIILKLIFLTERLVLRKNQKGLSNREKLRECPTFGSWCTCRQSKAQNLLSINLPILQETLRKEQKLIWSYSL